MGLIHRARKDFYLQAPEEEELIDWMACIQNSIRALSTRLPKGSQSERTVSQVRS